MPDTYPIDKVRSHLLSKSSAEYDATLVHPGTITGTVFSKDSLMALNLTQHDIDLLTMQDGDSIRDSAAESRQIPRTTVTPSKNRASASKFSILGSLEFLSNGKTASKREITESRSMPDDKEARNGDEVVDLAPPTMFLRSHVKQRRRSMFPEIFEKEKSLDMHQLDRKSVCAPTPSKGRRSSFANEFGRDGKPALTRDTSKSSLKNSSQQLNGLKRRLSAVGLLPWNGMIEVTMKDETKQIQAKNLATAADIRAEICNAFEIPPSEAAEYQIYVNASEIITKKLIRDTSIEDLDLLEICKTPWHQFQYHLVLDKQRHPVVAVPSIKQRILESCERGDPMSFAGDSLDQSDFILPADELEPRQAEIQSQRMQKLRKFFGNATPSTPSERINDRDLPEISNSKKKSATRQIGTKDLAVSHTKSVIERFFGHRPDPKLIADNLETFFPGISSFKDNSTASLIVSIQRSVEAQDEMFPLHIHPEVEESRESMISSKLSSNGRRKSLAGSHLAVPDDDSELFLEGNSSSESLSEIHERFAETLEGPYALKWIKGPLIGQGISGKVFYGVNTETGAIMAVKQVKVHRSTTTNRLNVVESILGEVSLLKGLNHPNIVRYHGYGLELGHVNVFLEYVSGGSVSSALATLGKFPELLVRSIAVQVLAGISHLHLNGIIHRDIKGANILLSETGWAKLSDFGVSKKRANAPLDKAYWNSSKMSLQGTVYWMAPEIVKDRGSFGCLIVEMANSGHPWDHLDEVQTMWRLGQDSKPPLPETVQGLTAEILNDCFIINPEARPTAMGLLKHPFCKRELQAFDFKSFKEEAILRNMNNEDDDSNRSSECQSMDDHHILDKLDSTVESPISPIYASGSTKMPSLKCVESPVSPMFALESANMLPPKCVESPILPLYASGSTNISSLK